MTPQDVAALERVEAGRRTYASHLWQHVPSNGSPIGNLSLRRRSKTVSATDYWDTRDAMVAAGLLELGGGRGGSVRRTEAFKSSAEESSVVASHGLELALYQSIRARLDEMLTDEDRFDDQVVAVTGLQGRRATGGSWSRPDITVVGLRRFKVLAGAHLEVSTYEVKTAASVDVVAIHEARAHRRRAHRAYVVVDLEGPEDEAKVMNLIDEARDLGVGLLSYVSVADEWSTWYEPELFLPDPMELDEFLATQLPIEEQEIIRRWHAQPAVAGTD